MEDAIAVTADTIVTTLAEVLGVAPDRIDRNRPLDQLGVDSLMGAELIAKMRRRLAGKFRSCASSPAAASTTWPGHWSPTSRARTPSDCNPDRCSPLPALYRRRTHRYRRTRLRPEPTHGAGPGRARHSHAVSSPARRQRRTSARPPARVVLGLSGHTRSWGKPC
ncbi:acyl carrier protein [Actinosynnema sp. ALI-1.44]|uniref:acyl carrier protein n=1 Tax=Actinosynnema sp. ALI-1.44 TaxID=1933779 RepID=UPI003F8D6732